MPLAYHEWVNNDLQLALWHITESVEDLCTRLFLNKEEYDTLNSFKSESRKKQWLSYRALIRHMVESEVIYRIHYDEHKKPFLVNPPRSISISHCSSYSAVLISKNLDIEHGVDVEPVDPKVLKVLSRFLNENEEKEWKKDKNPTKAVAYWSMKEALYKANGKSGLTLKENISILPFKMNSKAKIQGIVKSNEYTHQYQLYFRQINGLIISIAFKEY